VSADSQGVGEILAALDREDDHGEEAKGKEESWQKKEGRTGP
jgi:hypothetical protein